MLLDRLRNFDEDSDVDEIDQQVVRRPAVKRGQRSEGRGRDNSGSDDDSHDENNKSDLQPVNLRHNSRGNVGGGATFKGPVRMTSVRRIVSKPGNNSNETNEASQSKGFVPRDLSSKTKRSARGTQHTAEQWSSAPKKFLSEPPLDAPASLRNDQSRISSYAPTNKPPHARSNGLATKPGAFPPAPREWQNRVETADSDEEGSAHTDEPGDEKDQGNTCEDEDNDDVGGLAHRMQADSRYSDEALDDDPSIIQDGEFYEDYRARSLLADSTTTAATGVPSSSSSSPLSPAQGNNTSTNSIGSRPNKSGRYTDGDHQQQEESSTPPSALSGGWMAPIIGKRATSAWGAVQPPAGGPDSRHSFVTVAHARGARTEHVQCTVVRDRRASINGKLHPTYELILEDTNKAIIIAQKMNMNRTSNYHLFDLTRPNLSKKLSKKSGNYLGKLRAKNINRTEYVLLNQNSEREEIAGVRFDRITLINQIKEGNQPRKMKVVIPPNNEFGVPIPNRTADSDAGSLAEKLCEYERRNSNSSAGNTGTSNTAAASVISTTINNTAADSNGNTSSRGPRDPYVYESKDPVLENGNFRLNFHGRVSKPSVKNFQMVSRDDIDDIICQFGKVDEDVFHLDFKAPVTPVQAFAFALCQFNL